MEALRHGALSGQLDATPAYGVGTINYSEGDVRGISQYRWVRKPNLFGGQCCGREGCVDRSLDIIPVGKRCVIQETREIGDRVACSSTQPSLGHYDIKPKPPIIVATKGEGIGPQASSVRLSP